MEAHPVDVYQQPEKADKVSERGSDVTAPLKAV
jgi:hypothetical protein